MSTPNYSRIATFTYVVAAPVSALAGVGIGVLSGESGWAAGLASGAFLGVLGVAASLKDLQLAIGEDRTRSRRVEEASALLALSSELATHDDEIFRERANQAIEEATFLLKRAAAGELFLDESERVVVSLRLAAEVREEMCAILLWDPIDPLGAARSDYLDALKRSRARGGRAVEVRRLFVIETGDELNAQLHGRLREDLDAGVEVRVMFRSDWVPGDHELGQPVDFGIWDRKRVWKYHAREGRGDPGSRKASLFTGVDQVNRFLQVFDANFASGMAVESIVALGVTAGAGLDSDRGGGE